jgi:4-amino-4-deoxy-L-arabinose transferase-like glycosyltransferase
MKYLSSPILLTLLIILGLIVRLYDLDGESIWTDEGHTIYGAALNPEELIKENSRDNHPPLYSLILHYWMDIVPHTPFYLRLLSVIFGVLSIFLIYEVGRELIDKNVGLISAFLLSLSVFHIYFSQEVRSYAFVVVLILLSFLIFIKLIKNPTSYRIILFIIINVLLLYTHFLGWFILLAQNVYYLIRFPLNVNQFKYAIIINVIILLLYLPWLNVMVSRLSSIQEEFWVLLPSWLAIPQTFLIYSGTYTFFGICLLILFSLLCLNSLISYNKRRFRINWNTNDNRYLLVVWLWIPILIPFILSFVLTPIYITRITVGASLALYLLIAFGINKISKKVLRIGLLIVILIFSLANLGIYYNETNKERWDEMTEYIELNALPGDLLIFHAGFGLDKAFNFYATRDDLVKRPFPSIGLEIDEININEVAVMTEKFDRVWLVLSHSRDEDNLIIKSIENEFDLVQHKEYESFGINSHRPYIGIEVYQFER